jgi:transposase-like protein
VRRGEERYTTKEMLEKRCWRAVLDALIARGLRTPEFLLIDGGAGLERALASLRPEIPTQRCTVHKHRNLLAHAPDALHEEITADYNDMIYAENAAMLLWALLACGQITMRKVDGWQNLGEPPASLPLDLVA